MLIIESTGDFKNTERFLDRMSRGDLFAALHRYGGIGTAALAGATPVDTGATSGSWSHKVEISRSSATISWHNSNVNKGVVIALILQMGHGTGTGGYVVGRDYINPAIQPVFDKIADEVWKVVTSA